jgi:hypothetical protein
VHRDFLSSNLSSKIFATSNRIDSILSQEDLQGSFRSSFAGSPSSTEAEPIAEDGIGLFRAQAEHVLAPNGLPESGWENVLIESIAQELERAASRLQLERWRP